MIWDNEWTLGIWFAGMKRTVGSGGWKKDDDERRWMDGREESDGSGWMDDDDDEIEIQECLLSS